jgi:hypothetical protein
LALFPTDLLAMTICLIGWTNVRTLAISADLQDSSGYTGPNGCEGILGLVAHGNSGLLACQPID